MAAVRKWSSAAGGSTGNESLFDAISDDIERQGYSIRPAALPEDIAASLYDCSRRAAAGNYIEAGVGRGADFVRTEFIRTDGICWIHDGWHGAGPWLDWTAALQRFLNKHLFLGLFSFESHFAHYPPGAYYKRHYDAFRGEANRVLSVVTYLNPGWGRDDGGELVLYTDDRDREGIRVVPLYGTIVVFLSEEFPHEVLPACRDRYSVAGWYRLNGSIGNRIDPPR